MNVEHQYIDIDKRTNAHRDWLSEPKRRLGLVSSIDGSQLITLALNTQTNTAMLWESKIDGHSYHSMTPIIPQCHWFERTLWDMFGLFPEGHPRLKHNILHEPYAEDLLPLSKVAGRSMPENHRVFHAMNVKGDGIYEIPVGPIHAGIIEPGHFRFSCVGEVIFNLEIRLGYVHRGIEKRMLDVPWRNQRFVAEAAASDSASANALANSVAIESLFDVKVSQNAEYLRSISLEIERVAMHIADLSGLAGDIGFLAVSSTMARLRGSALRLAELLTGNRLQRGFICPGGVTRLPENNLSKIQTAAKQLKNDLKPVLSYFLGNQVARDRMENVGKVTHRMASDFALVGVAARASGISYDARQHFTHGAYPDVETEIAVEESGDVLSRARVRERELEISLTLIEKLIDLIGLSDKASCNQASLSLPDKLPANQTGLGIIEGHRGELIHLVFTDSNGHVIRYAIKDASVNNWTGLAIAARQNLVSDFPLCNKSFSLSYSGHDL